ncbi:hypothetical protein SAMN04488483_5410 [Pseudomonas helmanticensis]|uniref:Uncharacterized protein n=1 Tax=Pseudomonas helmanticensis TaxID=1471381 RepID=A0ACD2UDW4_9PSED|nr:hypothetical protein [Pseudomonas helmanticensis]SMQ30411.1 hypothetical protein SAMN04488483_5410 [Pseudomonas helmanticensis]
MSPKKTISKQNEEAALKGLKRSRHDKSSKHKLGADLDLLILLAETPKQCVDIGWDRMAPVGREI